MKCHELRPVGERGFYLYRVDHLGNAVKHVVAREHLSPSVHEVDHGSTVAGPLMDPRGQEGDRLRVVQPETALASLPGEFGRGEVDFGTDMAHIVVNGTATSSPPPLRSALEEEWLTFLSAVEEAEPQVHPPVAVLRDQAMWLARYGASNVADSDLHGCEN